MVQRSPHDRSPLSVALTRVPDLPRWIDTRGMLLSGRAVVAPADPDADQDFVVIVRDAALAAVVGRPPAEVIARNVDALAGDVNVIAQLDDVDNVAAALPGWRRRTAIIHVLPHVMAWEREADEHARVFARHNAPRFDHVREDLRRELIDALNGRTVSRFVPGTLPEAPAFAGRAGVPMAAMWADGRPVSFCYPVWQTEKHWDVSIETLDGYRGRGLGARAARTLIRHMRGSGRSPVWGALDTNTASRALAAKLGFLEDAGIAVFTAA